MTRTGPLIIGGGPAGAAAAIHLLRAGAAPTLVERQDGGHDALCGGFLSWRTLEQLAELGVDPAGLGGRRISALHVFAGRSAHEFALPGAAMGLSRRRLDRALLSQAQAMGATVLHAAAAYENGAVRLGSGQVFSPESVFLATGKHDLRGLARPRSAAGADPLLGLRLRLPGTPELQALLDDRIELHLFPGGYLGAVLQEDGSANLCLAVRKSRLTAAGGKPVHLLEQLAARSEALAERLAGIAGQPPIDAIAHVPYGWRATEGQPGLFRLGDQAGVIPSLAGEGIGVALASARAAAEFWRQGGGKAAPAYQRAFARRLRRPFLAARTIAAAGMHPLAPLPLRLLAAVPGAAGLMARATRV